MVMASTVPYQRHGPHDPTHEVSDAHEGAAAAASLHERLVAYVHALTGGQEPRSGVWVEHSYARARGVAAAPAAAPRVLLAPRAASRAADVDVERLDPEPAPPPDERETDDADYDDDDDDSDVGDEDREARVTALAPTAAHAHLAESAFETLRRMRLARLAGGGCSRAESARAAARRLRLALAAAAAARPRAAPWLHAALLANLSRSARAMYGAAVAELWRAAPRAAARMTGGSEPARAAPSAVPVKAGGAGPWLVWVGGGRVGLEERWARRLGALVHVRRAGCGAAGAAGAAGTVEAWCSAVASGARSAVLEALSEAGERAVMLGGVGAGAALCVALAGSAGAGGARVRGLVLLAPPLMTAEGADEPLAGVGVPVLVVAGTGAAASWRGAAREACGGGSRRLLELRGADDALRVPRAVRARLRLPQHALEAAVAEECARWIAETAENDDAHEWERERERPRRRGVEPEDEEYAHLPAAARAAAAPPGLDRSDRSIEIVGECESFERRRRRARRADGCSPERRVVSRGPGGTPLALLPPRRSPAAPAPLAAADIMHLPIVFADDEGPSAEPASPVTVTSGEGEAGAGAGAGARYTRVIVAKRGAGGGARPVLLRRGLRLVPRDPDR